MFLKYPKKVRYMINYFLNEDVVIVSRDRCNKNRFVVEKYEDVIEIGVNAEIFTRYGKAKLLYMEKKWYLYIQLSKVVIKNFKDRRYRDGFCEYIYGGEDIVELKRICMNRFNEFKNEYKEYRQFKFNGYIEDFIEEADYNIRSMLACVAYDRRNDDLKYTYITDANMEKINKLICRVSQLNNISNIPD